MSHDTRTPDAGRPDTPAESSEERARRVAEIKRRVAQGNYIVDSREILYNMLKTAP